MTNPENLVPHQIKSTKRARELGRKGGLVISKKKKYAAKIREMRKRGMTNADVEWLLLTLEDPNASVMDMRNDIESLKENMSPQDYLRIKQANHKLKYGEFQRTENVHHVINWGDMFKDAEIRSKKDSE